MSHSSYSTSLWVAWFILQGFALQSICFDWEHTFYFFRLSIGTGAVKLLSIRSLCHYKLDLFNNGSTLLKDFNAEVDRGKTLVNVIYCFDFAVRIFWLNNLNTMCNACWRDLAFFFLIPNTNIVFYYWLRVKPQVLWMILWSFYKWKQFRGNNSALTLFSLPSLINYPYAFVTIGNVCKLVYSH